METFESSSNGSTKCQVVVVLVLEELQMSGRGSSSRGAIDV